MRLEVDPNALRAASERAAHDGWSIRLAADDVARALIRARDHLGGAGGPSANGIAPLIDAARRVADSEARLAESLGVLAESYRQVDGQTADRQRSAAAWG